MLLLIECRIFFYFNINVSIQQYTLAFIWICWYMFDIGDKKSVRLVILILIISSFFQALPV